ncbi:MAG: DUF302 domain-containing protein [Gammaproteobacteria bacterium]|nr:DUF302 domain-containing protein [Gammaproteobacteria bacterium]
MKYFMKSTGLITVFIITILTSAQLYAQADDGIERIKSAYSVTETIDRLENALKTKGMTVFKRISHSDNAEKVGLDLRPTELLVFGNPKLGTLLMQCQQLSAIDLPMKALAYEDEQGQVWLAYNKPEYLENRHRIKNCDEALQKISKALANFSRMATE